VIIKKYTTILLEDSYR